MKSIRLTLLIPMLLASTQAQASPAGDAYKAAVFAVLAPAWEAVVTNAAEFLPKGHRANQPNTMTEVAISLDEQGNFDHARVTKRSGDHRFDNSAMRVASLLRYKLPELPSKLRFKKVSMRWRFYRDGRRCKPEYAEIKITPLPAAKRLARLLANNKLAMAERLLQSAALDETSRSVLFEWAWRTDDPALWRLALTVAPRWQLGAVLDSPRTPTGRWRIALSVAVERADGVLLRSVFKKLHQPGQGWRAPSTDERQAQRDRMERVVVAAQRVNVKLDQRALVEIARSTTQPSVVLAAADSGIPADVLQSIAEKQNDPRIAGPLWVRLAQATPSAVLYLERIGIALGGKGAAEILNALESRNVPGLEEHLAALALNRKRSPQLRAQALTLLARTDHSRIPLYRCLKDQSALVRAAAIAGLASNPGDKLVTSYRLAAIAYPAKSNESADALVAMTRASHPNFRADITRVVQRLPDRIAYQTLERVKSHPGIAAAYFRIAQNPRRMLKLRYRAAALLSEVAPETDRSLLDLPPQADEPEKRASGDELPTDPAQRVLSIAARRLSAAGKLAAK